MRGVALCSSMAPSQLFYLASKPQRAKSAKELKHVSDNEWSLESYLSGGSLEKRKTMLGRTHLGLKHGTLLFSLKIF